MRVYRTIGGAGRVAEEVDENDVASAGVARDYDVEHYSRLLRDTFAARLARAFTREDFGVVFADPDQLALFAPSLDTRATDPHDARAEPHHLTVGRNCSRAGTS